MPKMVEIGLNKLFKAETDADKKAVEAAKRAGSITVPYVTALENIKLSRGLYALVENVATAPQPGPRALEDMDYEELKLMMLTAGVTPQKVMKREDIIKSIRSKLAAIEIVGEG
jgi:hypothetical protein